MSITMMAEAQIDLSTPQNPLKRPLLDTPDASQSEDTKSQYSGRPQEHENVAVVVELPASSPESNSATLRETSPAPSSSTLSSAPASFGVPPPNGSIRPDVVDGPLRKKRRTLTAAEKEEQIKIKENKAQAKAQRKSEKEEADALKHEERRAKNEEKESRQREKDLKRQQKEVEKKQKEEEEVKKQRVRSSKDCHDRSLSD